MRLELTTNEAGNLLEQLLTNWGLSRMKVSSFRGCDRLVEWRFEGETWIIWTKTCPTTKPTWAAL